MPVIEHDGQLGRHGHGAVDAALAFFQGLEREAVGFQVYAVSARASARRQLV